MTAQKAEASSTAGRAAGSGTSFLPERLKTVPEPPRFATARVPQTFAPPPGGGEPLGEPLRSRMEASFGHDFSAVRVHQSERAARWGAVAVAQGDHLHFAPGRYQPATAAGRRVIGHELAHVVQQRQGLFRGHGGAGVLEGEAASLGDRAAHGQLCAVRGAARGPQFLLDEEAIGELRTYLEERLSAIAVEPVLEKLSSLYDSLDEIKEAFERNPVLLDILEAQAIFRSTGVRRRILDAPVELVPRRPEGRRGKRSPSPPPRFLSPSGSATKLLRSELRRSSQEQQGEEEIVGREEEEAGPVEDPWETAAPGKQFRDSEYSFESIQKTVMELDPRREDRDPTFREWKEAAAWTPESLFEKFTESKHLAALKKRASVTWGVLDAQTRTQVATLFGWLIPLQNETITKIDSKKILMKQMASAIEELLGQGGVPKDALIRKKAPITILNHEAGKAYSLGVESEVITGKLGALKSGELAEGRGLESDLNQEFQLGRADPQRFIAGHLVAGSLGGKFQDWNLTPLTNLFNTTGENDGIKDAETEGLGLINHSRVIHYKTTVTYGNREDVQWWKAVLPTRLEIEVSTMRLKPNGTPSDIRDWSVPDPAHRYDLNPMKSVRWL